MEMGTVYPLSQSLIKLNLKPQFKIATNIYKPRVKLYVYIENYTIWLNFVCRLNVPKNFAKINAVKKFV